jgi:hypothetical protein
VSQGNGATIFASIQNEKKVDPIAISIQALSQKSLLSFSLQDEISHVYLAERKYGGKKSEYRGKRGPAHPPTFPVGMRFHTSLFYKGTLIAASLGKFISKYKQNKKQ